MNAKTERLGKDDKRSHVQGLFALLFVVIGGILVSVLEIYPHVPSLLAAIGGIIERHMIDTGFLQPNRSGELGDADAGQKAMVVNDGSSGGFRQCPRCGDAALTFQEGCETCLSCGHSKCA